MLFVDVFKVFTNETFCIFQGKSDNLPQSVTVPPYIPSSLMKSCENNVTTWEFFTFDKVINHFEVTRLCFVQSIKY